MGPFETLRTVLSAASGFDWKARMARGALERIRFAYSTLVWNPLVSKLCCVLNKYFIIVPVPVISSKLHSRILRFEVVKLEDFKQFTSLDVQLMGRNIDSS